MKLLYYFYVDSSTIICTHKTDNCTLAVLINALKNKGNRLLFGEISLFRGNDQLYNFHKVVSIS